MLRILILLALLLGSSGAGAASAPHPLQRADEAAVDRWLRLRPRLESLRPTRLKLSQLRALQERRAPSSLQLLVVGCDFSDSLMVGRDRDDFPGWPAARRTAQLIPGTAIPVFAAHDSTYFDLQMRRVSDYFSTVSFGQFSMSWDVHPVIVNLPRPMAYYGDPDSSDVRVVGMAREVIDAIDDDVDFSLYDTVVLIHAGAGKETDILGDSREQIFSNYLDQRDFASAAEAGILPAPELVTAETAVEHVLILPESESQDPVGSVGGFFDVRGVYCFEFGLRLGMLSLADFTPSSFPDSQGIGNFGLMGYGLFTGLGIVPAAPCAMNRMLMGWVDAVEVRADADIRLGAVGEAGAAVSDTLLVKVPISDREYWLLEYRLQDPDGDLFYGFDDLNANFVPDYFDADSEIGGGIPTSTYDPASDTWESELGAEFDYFMSENPARSADRCMRGGGSGVYIYHVDERVITNSILSGTNTINADRDHKGVDVEEADGIQDLDSPRPSPYLLGWDHDTWRGEGAAVFGPDSTPSTATADGLPTGIRFTDFSEVVLDSFPRDENGNCVAFRYRSAVTFRVEFAAVDAAAVPEIARHVFSEAPALYDPRVVDLGTAPGTAAADGTSEIVLAGDAGRVYAFTGDLTEWLDGDADPLTEGVLAVASGLSGPPHWLGPPAVLDLDADGVLDLVLVAEEGVYAFSSADGSELLDGDINAATVGLLWAAPEGRLRGPAIAWTEGAQPRVVVVQESPSGVTVQRITADATTVSAVVGPVVAGESLGHAVYAPDGRVGLTWRDSEGPGFLLFEVLSNQDFAGVRLPALPAPQAISTVDLAGFGPALAWVDREGRDHLTTLPTAPAAGPQSLAAASDRVGPGADGAVSGIAGGPIEAGGRGPAWLTRAAGGALLSLDPGLRSRVGFPYRGPRIGASAQTDSMLAAPLLVDVDGNGPADALWHDGSGVLHSVDSSGRPLSGWPRVGPGEPGGSPAVANVSGDDRLELVTVGRFGALVDANAPARSPVLRRVGELRIYQLMAPGDAHRPWPQGRGDVRNAGVQQPTAGSGAGGGVLRDGSLLVSPNPAVGDVVRVRADVERAADAMITIYNLEGEEVARLGPVTVPQGAALDEAITVSGLVSGLYLCRVEAAGEVLTGAFAVVR